MKSTIRKITSKFFKSNGASKLSLMMIITMITQLVSIYKSSMIAANFGASVELDAYNFANNLSTFFLTFISSGISTVIIPAYVKKMDKNAMDTFLSIVFTVVGALLLVFYIFRIQIVALLTTRDNVFQLYVCNLLLLCILMQLLPAILSVTTAYYQCIGKFNLPKIILLISNIGIVVALSIKQKYDIYEYLYILLGGAIFQFLFDLILAIKYGFRYSIKFELKNPHFIEMKTVFMPTVFSTGIYKINTMVDSLLSSNVGTGQLTILSYANMIVAMVNNMVIGNLTAYVFPKIVDRVKEDKLDGQKIMWKYAVLFHAFVCLLICGFFCVGREFVGLLLEHGKFSNEASTAVYICMCIYIFAQQNNIIRDLIYRLFFANGDTKTTVNNGIITSIVNIVVSILMTRLFGVYGIILGTYIAGMVSLFGIIIHLKQKFGLVQDFSRYVTDLIKTELALIITILCIWGLKQILGITNYVSAFMVYGVLCTIIYLGIILLLKSGIVKQIKSYMQ